MYHEGIWENHADYWGRIFLTFGPLGHTQDTLQIPIYFWPLEDVLTLKGLTEKETRLKTIFKLNRKQQTVRMFNVQISTLVWEKSLSVGGIAQW